MPTALKRLLLWWLCMGKCVAMLSQHTAHAGRLDSLQHMSEVVVTSHHTFREVIPSQQLKGDELRRLSAQSVADAMRFFSGIQLKDYGGVGGVKTIDVRSMGTNHLAVSYDGITLGNAQNGQTDLGQLSLDNIEEVTLYNGQKSSIFQSASDFASASAVYIRTRLPRFEVGSRSHLKFRAKFGSSDLLRSSVLWEQKLNNNLFLSANAEVTTASGKYRFRYKRKNLDGTVAWDTTATRQNGDIQAGRVELNLHGMLNHGQWMLKTYVYNSNRGIPGAIVNNVWSRGERQKDLNSFIQTSWQQSLGNWFSTRWMAKYAYYRTHYANRDSTVLPVNNIYYQQELYLSTANVVELLPNWSASLSYDLRWNKLLANTYNFAFPTRFTHMLSVATAIDCHHLKMQASVVGVTTDHRVRNGSPQHAEHQLSPAVFANLYPFGSQWLSLRAFVKRSYRLPTFNDLYYTELGHASLKPERATQVNLGVLVQHAPASSAGGWGLTLQTDIYYNKVSDKIIAYPKGQQFRWTMLNLGEVDIRGIDVAGTVHLPLKGLSLRGQYTFQRAIDVTDASRPFYRHQIPYIPRHAGSAIVQFNHKRLSLNYSFIYTGERWNAQVNNEYNHMQPWYTHDLAANYTLPLKKGQMKLTLEVNNIFNQQYDVIANYPMPGRNAYMGVELEL